MADTFLAVFTGNKTSPRAQAFWSLPEAEQQAKMKEGIAAWHAWMERHADAIVFAGGPLGKTKKVGPDGVADSSNALGGFIIGRLVGPLMTAEGIACGTTALQWYGAHALGGALGGFVGDAIGQIVRNGHGRDPDQSRQASLAGGGR